jgi:hypothetical protein
MLAMARLPYFFGFGFFAGELDRFAAGYRPVALPLISNPHFTASNKSFERLA